MGEPADLEITEYNENEHFREMMMHIFGLETSIAKNVAYSLPLVLLNAGILKDVKSLEVLCFGLSRPVLPSLSDDLATDPFTIGPVLETNNIKRKKWTG